MTDDFNVPDNWYEDFFHEPANRFWEAVVPPGAADEDAQGLIRALQLDPPAAIFDIACGAGRHSRALARHGFDVTGIDISADAIARARELSNGLPIALVEANLLSLPAVGPFDGACWMGNGFAYFDTGDTLAILGALRRTMKPGSKLVVESYSSAESVFAGWRQDQKHDFPGGTYEAQSRYDPRTARLASHALLTLDGKQHRLRYAHIIRTAAETAQLFEKAGWTVAALDAGLGGEPYMIGSPRLVVTAIAP